MTTGRPWAARGQPMHRLWADRGVSAGRSWIFVPWDANEDSSSRLFGGNDMADMELELWLV